MLVKNDKQRDRLLVNDLRPPSGTKIYAVRVLKDNLPLDRALQLARRAEDTDDLSHSEPTELGRGMRKKFVRQLTSDDDDDDEIAAQRPRQENQLTGWPTPPRILQLSRALESFSSTSAVETPSSYVDAVGPSNDEERSYSSEFEDIDSSVTLSDQLLDDVSDDGISLTSSLILRIIFSVSLRV
ncbi:hypothetical protein SprV_0401699200 [Sparganum proliferum]